MTVSCGCSRRHGESWIREDSGYRLSRRVLLATLDKGARRSSLMNGKISSAHRTRHPYQFRHPFFLASSSPFCHFRCIFANAAYERITHMRQTPGHGLRQLYWNSGREVGGERRVFMHFGDGPVDIRPLLLCRTEMNQCQRSVCLREALDRLRRNMSPISPSTVCSELEAPHPIAVTWLGTYGKPSSDYMKSMHRPDHIET